MNINNNKKLNRVSDGERFSKIALLNEVIFHANDLASIWNIQNENTLHKTISRYIKRGLLYRIYNGFYSIKKIKELDPYLLGVKSLHSSCYVSCESILYENGILNQKPQVITLVSSISKSFSILDIHYRSRKIKDKYLFNDSGIEIINGVRKASLSRAVADMLYFNKKKYFDSLDSSLINWNSVQKIIKLIGYKIKNPSISLLSKERRN